MVVYGFLSFVSLGFRWGFLTIIHFIRAAVEIRIVRKKLYDDKNLGFVICWNKDFETWNINFILIDLLVIDLSVC